MSAGPNGFFRSKQGFTVVQNDIVNDASISLKAKGMYLVIQSNITRPGQYWTKDDFIKLSTDGKKAFESGWVELKLKGYLKVHLFPNGNNWRVEYDLLDSPEEGVHTYYYNKKGEVTLTRGGETEGEGDEVPLPAETVQKPSETKTDMEAGDKKTISDTEVSGQDAFRPEDATTSVEQNCDGFQKENGEKVPANPVNNAYTQNGGYAKNEVLRTPHLGIYAKGSTAKGIYANGGNEKSKDYIYKPDYKDNTLNPSFLPIPSLPSAGSETEEGIKEGNRADRYADDMEADGEVILNLNEVIPSSEIASVKKEIVENGGIPYSYVNCREKMIRALQLMSGWSDFEITHDEDRDDPEIYRLAVECLAELATSEAPVECKGSKVSAVNVVDRINAIYKNEYNKIYCLENVFERIIERFKSATVRTEIKNPKLYLRSMTWEMLNIYVVEWKSYFNRTFYGGHFGSD